MAKRKTGKHARRRVRSLGFAADYHAAMIESAEAAIIRYGRDAAAAAKRGDCKGVLNAYLGAATAGGVAVANHQAMEGGRSVSRLERDVDQIRTIFSGACEIRRK